MTCNEINFNHVIMLKSLSMIPIPFNMILWGK
eukprot:UN19861